MSAAILVITVHGQANSRCKWRHSRDGSLSACSACRSVNMCVHRLCGAQDGAPPCRPQILQILPAPRAPGAPPSAFPIRALALPDNSEKFHVWW